MADIQAKIQNFVWSLFSDVSANFGYGVNRDNGVFSGEIAQFVEVDLPEILANFMLHVQTLPPPRGERPQPGKNSPHAGDLAEILSWLKAFFRQFFDQWGLVPFTLKAPAHPTGTPGANQFPREGGAKLVWPTQGYDYIGKLRDFTKYAFVAEGVRIRFEILGSPADDGETKHGKSPQNHEKGQKYLFLENIEPIPEKVPTKIKITFRRRGPRREEAASLKKGGKKLSQERVHKWNLHQMSAHPSVAALDPLQTDYRLALRFHGDFPETCEGKADTQGSPSLLGWHYTNFVDPPDRELFICRDLRRALAHALREYITGELMQHLRPPSGPPPDTRGEAPVLLEKIECFRKIASGIIRYHGKIEDRKKEHWSRPKAIRRTDYCITLDLVPPHLYPEILANPAQIAVWAKNFMLTDSIQPEEGDSPPFGAWDPRSQVEYLENHPALMVDTQYFDRTFKFQLLATIPNLDEQITGILVHGDNYQALQLLQPKFSGQFQCVYIDPPYNAQPATSLYRNAFDHASWLTMIENRLELLPKFLDAQEGALIVAIDENEQERLGLLLEAQFPDYGRTCVAIVHNPGGIQGANFAQSHEYAYFIYPPSGRQIAMEDRADSADVRNFMNTAKGNTRNYLREAGVNCFYPILVQNGHVVGFGDICPPDFHPPVNLAREDGIIEVYPVDGDGVERKWVFARETVETVKGDLSAKYSTRRNVWQIIRTKRKINYKTVWTRKKYVAKTHGTRYLNQMLGTQNARFSFPKSIYLVEDCIAAGLNGRTDGLLLDFFAGSGTSGEAVLNLNARNDSKGINAGIKFVLVERGPYFDRLLKERLIHRVYADAWKHGQPQSKRGIPHQIFKYHELGALDDYFRPPPAICPGDQHFAGGPFSAKCDLCETFNYLEGIKVKSYDLKYFRDSPYVIVHGTRKKKACVVIWKPPAVNADLEAEFQFLTKEINAMGDFEEIFVFGKTLIPGAISVSKELNRLLGAKSDLAGGKHGA